MTRSISKYQAATALAILFHVVGITGMLFFDKDFFIGTTIIHLLLMFALLLWTSDKNLAFVIFLLVTFIGGIAVEIIGVNTGVLFGDYQYGNVLGPRVMKVPWMIGINWFIIVYCCGISVNMLLTKITEKLGETGSQPAPALKALSIIVDGATLAVFFDWLLEPVAVNLNYWKWNGNIPFYNYLCWFIVSMLLLAVFHFCKFEKKNKFAVNLLLIQMMFFLILRTFMN